MKQIPKIQWVNGWYRDTEVDKLVQWAKAAAEEIRLLKEEKKLHDDSYYTLWENNLDMEDRIKRYEDECKGD